MTESKEGASPKMPQRYFYPASRAHHAYSMAIDFGMEFEKRDGKWSLEGLKNIDPASSYRIYIHPNSLPLVEPREGDGVEFDRWFWERQRDHDLKDTPYAPHLGRVIGFKALRPDGGKWQQISSAGIGWDDNYNGMFAMPFKIIQRNGIAFHWPESEAA